MNTEAENIPRKLEGKFGAMVVCCILGVGQLVAWNTILTISDYYYQIFPGYHPAPARTLAVVYQPFVLGTILILVSVGQKRTNRTSILIGYSLFFIGTIFLITVDLVTKGTGGLLPFLVVCFTAAFFGIANACVEGAMVGELFCISPDLLQPFAAGIGIAGAMTSCLRLVTKSVFDNMHNGLRKGALLFLGISSLVTLMCLVLYGYIFPRLLIVKNYRAQLASNQRESPEESQVPRVNKVALMRENIEKVISLFVTYALSLSIFPGFLYENTGKHQLSSWYPLVLVTCFTVSDALSRYITLVKRLKLESGKWIIICVAARVLFVHAFYFTAKYADQGWMIFLTSFLGITNGYLTVCSLIGPSRKNYDASQANVLGNMLVASMLGGIFAGVCLSWLWLIGSKNKV